MMWKLILAYLLFTTFVSSQRPCNLYCGEDESNIYRNPTTRTLKGDNGSPGKKGAMGIQGDQGVKGIKGQKGDLGLPHYLPSCLQISNDRNASNNGVYHIEDSTGIVYPVYCDMTIDGGGWTLVATIHENNIRASGRCTTGDKWSSEHGNSYHSQTGANAWSNYETFGRVISATSDDYKNAAYFDLQASNIMIWQVPDDTPLSNFSSSSYLQYRTTNGFLSQYGGNLFNLYKTFFPIKSDVYTKYVNNGPAIPVTFDKGNAAALLSHYGTNVQPLVESGYIQFRAINNERSAYALCPGTKAKSSHGNVEHSCIGSTGDNLEIRYCGDFSAYAFGGYGTGKGWETDITLLKTTYFIFYR